MAATGILIRLDQVRFDEFGRLILADAAARRGLDSLFRRADALACRSGCGAPLSCDTALICREELTTLGPELLINNADFATIIRKRKAVGARDTVIVFEAYQRLVPGAPDTQAPGVPAGPV